MSAHRCFSKFSDLREKLKRKRNRKFRDVVSGIDGISVRQLSFETEPRIWVTAEKRKEVVAKMEEDIAQSVTFF